jgi:hypothetical protein
MSANQPTNARRKSTRHPGQGAKRREPGTMVLRHDGARLARPNGPLGRDDDEENARQSGECSSPAIVRIAFA